MKDVPTQGSKVLSKLNHSRLGICVVRTRVFPGQNEFRIHGWDRYGWLATSLYFVSCGQFHATEFRQQIQPRIIHPLNFQ